MDKNKKQQIKDIEVTPCSGNIYADTGHPNPEEAMAKAKLAILITTTIKKKKLTQKQAAALIGIDQPKISDIIRGKLSGFTLDRLFRFLRSLGIGIEIEPKVYPETVCQKINYLPPLTVLPCQFPRKPYHARAC